MEGASKCATYRGPNDARVPLDPSLVARHQECKRADTSCDEKLGRQDGVDLSDELVADLDGGFGDGTSKL